MEVVGSFLATAAHMERASVPAFFDLRDELARHGGPRGMRSSAVRAARDEVRHADAIERLAEAVGATVPAIERAEPSTRTMWEMAEDNAAVGCVGEAHAALVAAHQAAHAPTSALRRIFDGIARDEARHALLSFAIHDWASARLPSRQARELDERRREAHAALVRVEAAGVDPILTRSLGVPDADRAVSLAHALA